MIINLHRCCQPANSSSMPPPPLPPWIFKRVHCCELIGHWLAVSHIGLCNHLWILMRAARVLQLGCHTNHNTQAHRYTQSCETLFILWVNNKEKRKQSDADGTHLQGETKFNFHNKTSSSIHRNPHLPTWHRPPGDRLNISPTHQYRVSGGHRRPIGLTRCGGRG